MKIAWENDRPVVVGRNLRSSWPDAPNQERRRQEWLYPVMRVGAINMQACSYDAWVDSEYSRMASDIVDNLFD